VGIDTPVVGGALVGKCVLRGRRDQPMSSALASDDSIDVQLPTREFRIKRRVKTRPGGLHSVRRLAIPYNPGEYQGHQKLLGQV
jgi:hypothetical protein